MINTFYYFESTYIDMIHDKHPRNIGDIVYCSDTNSLYVYNGELSDKINELVDAVNELRNK